MKSLSEWTPDPAEARNFTTSEKALGFCAEHRIPAVQIVLKFEYDRYDISVPITKECEDGVPGTQRALLS